MLAPFSSIDVFAERYILVRHLLSSFSVYKECSLWRLLSSSMKPANGPREPKASTGIPLSEEMDISAGLGNTLNSAPSASASSNMPTSEESSGTIPLVRRILMSIFLMLKSRSLRSHCICFVACFFSPELFKSKASPIAVGALVISFSFLSSC